MRPDGVFARARLTCAGIALCLVNPLPGAETVPFRRHVIAEDLKGGYQVVAADLDRDGDKDLIALASGMPELVWFESPGWKRHVITDGRSRMINLAPCEVDAGKPLVIVLAEGFSNQAPKSDGIVLVLEADEDIHEPWKVREIDRLTTSHRIRCADIDGSGRTVYINAPLTGADAVGPEYRDHVPLVYYRPGEWKRELIGEQNEGVMHGIYVLDWDRDTRDEILTASFSGIHLFDLENGAWKRTEIAKGAPSPWPKSGSSDIAVGQLGQQRFIASIEPWHGDQLAVYLETNDGWTREVIDTSYTDGHTVVTADLNADDNDEIVAGHRGNGGGVYLYTSADRAGRRWERQVLGQKDVTVAACDVADFNGDRRPDIACIGSASANLVWYENQR